MELRSGKCSVVLFGGVLIWNQYVKWKLDSCASVKWQLESEKEKSIAISISIWFVLCFVPNRLRLMLCANNSIRCFGGISNLIFVLFFFLSISIFIYSILNRMNRGGWNECYACKIAFLSKAITALLLICVAHVFQYAYYLRKMVKSQMKFISHLFRPVGTCYCCLYLFGNSMHANFLFSSVSAYL